MIIIFLIAPIVICALLCIFQVFIHETGHYIKIKKWTKKLKWDTSGTTIYIGDENSKVLFKMGIYRIMSKGFMETGTTVSPFFKQLALLKNEKKNYIILDVTSAGALSVFIVGFTLLYILQIIAILNTQLFTPLILSLYLPLSISTAVFAFIIFKSSFGANKENSDLYFWKNPKKFIEYFKE